MYSNEFSANEKHYKRSITITDDNEVIISEFSSNIDCERETHCRLKLKRSISQ